MDFLLEVGTEELPADFVDSAIAQLQERVSKSPKGVPGKTAFTT